MATKETVQKTKKISMRFTNGDYQMLQEDVKKNHTDFTNYITMLIRQNHQNPINKVYILPVQRNMERISSSVLDLRKMLYKHNYQSFDSVEPYLKEIEKGVQQLWQSLL